MAVSLTKTERGPAYCAKQARRTPAIPTHNGFPRCIACGAALYVGPDGKVRAS
jgi:hypothetical protein